MTKYHYNVKTGETGICRASKKPCPLGDDALHKDFSTKIEADAWASGITEALNSTFLGKLKKSVDTQSVEDSTTVETKLLSDLRSKYKNGSPKGKKFGNIEEFLLNEDFTNDDDSEVRKYAIKLEEMKINVDMVRNTDTSEYSDEEKTLLEDDLFTFEEGLNDSVFRLARALEDKLSVSSDWDIEDPNGFDYALHDFAL